MFIVAAADPVTGERGGCLVGFATQCRIDPPRLLVCLSRTNHTYRVACAAPVLAVHLLDDCPHRIVGTVRARWNSGDHDGFLLVPREVSAWAGGRALMFSGVRDLRAGHPA